MKRLVFPLLLTIILAASCKEDSSTNPLAINSMNKISFQETLSNGNLSIQFVEVTEDSRCPTSLNCIWEGIAKIKFEINLNRTIIPFELYSPNVSAQQMNSDTIISDYRIELIKLEPYPETSDEIPKSTYFAEILFEEKNWLQE